jgi:hypothetical protein
MGIIDAMSQLISIEIRLCRVVFATRFMVPVEAGL